MALSKAEVIEHIRDIWGKRKPGCLGIDLDVEEAKALGAPVDTLKPGENFWLDDVEIDWLLTES